MDKRKAELEAKRAKLAELRKAREERKTGPSTDAGARESPDVGLNSPETRGSSTPPSSTTAPVPPVSVRDRSEDVDALVAQLVGEPRGSASSPLPGYPEDGSARAPSTVPPAESPAPRYTPVLSMSSTAVIDFAPKEKVTYSKEVQTMAIETEDFPEEKKGDDGSADTLASGVAAITLKDEKHVEIQPEPAPAPPKPRELNDDERQQILQSETFIDFVDRSSKIIERVLSEPYDYMKDYTISGSSDRDMDIGKSVKAVLQFSDEKFTRHRAVTDCSFSTTYPELVLASYNRSTLAAGEADGLAIVWNQHLQARPEFVFRTQSDVMTAMFSPFHPNMIIGGTYSGQIVLWDTRAKADPVLKTPLTGSAHTHPVYSMSITGTHNAHSLLSASTDGLVTTWQLDMLAQPQETLELTRPQNSKTDEVAITCMALPDNETATFWVGTEEGPVYQVNRHDQAGSKAGINDSYRGHTAAVTGINFHPLFGPANLSSYFLTSSVDWTISLWRAKTLNKTSAIPDTISPIMTFNESDDHVYDVKWSPSHPAVFASVDGSGRFDIYNLNQDPEIPIVSTYIDGGGVALNKLAWTGDGRRSAIGSADGRLHIFDVGSISVATNEDYSQLARSLEKASAR